MWRVFNVFCLLSTQSHGLHSSHDLTTVMGNGADYCACNGPPSLQPQPRSTVAPRRPFNVTLVTVCEKEAGKLKATLACNKHQVDRVIVITTKEDKKTHKVCSDEGVDCHITDKLHRNSDVFNKGAAIQEVQSSLHRDAMNANSVILLLDSDICLPSAVWTKIPHHIHTQKRVLFTSLDRCLFENPHDYSRGWPALQSHWHQLSLGMFQMYVCDTKAPLYSHRFPTASESDIEFARQFKKVHNLHLVLAHLGSPSQGANWLGVARNDDMWAFAPPPPDGTCPCCTSEQWIRYPDVRWRLQESG